MYAYDICRNKKGTIYIIETFYTKLLQEHVHVSFCFADILPPNTRV